MTALNDRGIAYGAKGDNERAIKDFDQVVKLDANNAVALNNRGIAYRNKGEYDRAIADFDEAIKLNAGLRGGDLQPRHRLLRQARLRPRHRELRRRRSSSMPSNVLALHDRGVARYDKHDYERAIADFDQLVKSGVSLVVALNPKDRAADRQLGYDRGGAGSAAPAQAQPELRAGLQRSRP